MTTLPELSDGLRLTNTGHAHLNARLRERIDELTEEVAALRRRDRAGSWWRAAIKIVNTLRGGR